MNIVVGSRIVVIKSVNVFSGHLGNVGNKGTITRMDSNGHYSVQFDGQDWGSQSSNLGREEIALVGLTKGSLVAGETLLKMRNGQVKLFVGGTLLLGSRRQARSNLDNYNDELLRINVSGTLIKDVRDGDIIAHGKLDSPAKANAFSGYNSGIDAKVEWTTIEHPNVLTTAEAQDKYGILIVGGKH
jgi:hypothetical protein